MDGIGAKLTGKINHKKSYKIDNKRLDSNWKLINDYFSLFFSTFTTLLKRFYGN